MRAKGMKVALLSAVLAASVRVPVPYAPPAVINESDCPSAFAMDVRPRRNPGSVGSVTADGYPVLLRPSGAAWYVMPQGMSLPAPAILRGYPGADFSPGPGPAAVPLPAPAY